jgi:di/tricarboxylate transporter
MLRDEIKSGFFTRAQLEVDFRRSEFVESTGSELLAVFIAFVHRYIRMVAQHSSDMYEIKWVIFVMFCGYSHVYS